LNSPSPPSRTVISLGEAGDLEKLLTQSLGIDKEKWQKELVDILTKKAECKVALGLTLIFLEKLLLLDTALPVSTIEYCDGLGFSTVSKAMLIDA